MNDADWCKVLRTAARRVEDRQYTAASDSLYLGRRWYTSSQSKCASDLDTLLDGMKRYGGAPASEFINKVNRILRNHGDGGLFGVEKMLRYAEAYNASQETFVNGEGATTGRLSCTQPSYQSIPKAACDKLAARLGELIKEQPVNKTIADIQAELDAAVAAKAEKDIIDQRAAELTRYFRLHLATSAVLTDIRDKAVTPRALLAEFRSELKALAAEFGYRIVLVGDRTAAVLVQQ